MLVLSLFMMMMMMTTASADTWKNNVQRDTDQSDNNEKHFNHRYREGGDWQRTHHQDFSGEQGMPFRWHEHREGIRHDRFEPMHDHEWESRFPGQHPHRWHSDEGFWHHGHHVNDAVLFFDDNGELVSVGYVVDGVFVHFREDHECYESHDSFFMSFRG